MSNDKYKIDGVVFGERPTVTKSKCAKSAMEEMRPIIKRIAQRVSELPTADESVRHENSIFDKVDIQRIQQIIIEEGKFKLVLSVNIDYVSKSEARVVASYRALTPEGYITLRTASSQCNQIEITESAYGRNGDQLLWAESRALRYLMKNIGIIPYRPAHEYTRGDKLELLNEHQMDSMSNADEHLSSSNNEPLLDELIKDDSQDEYQESLDAFSGDPSALDTGDAEKGADEAKAKQAAENAKAKKAADEAKAKKAAEDAKAKKAAEDAKAKKAADEAEAKKAAEEAKAKKAAEDAKTKKAAEDAKTKKAAEEAKAKKAAEDAKTKKAAAPVEKRKSVSAISRLASRTKKKEPESEAVDVSAGQSAKGDTKPAAKVETAKAAPKEDKKPAAKSTAGKPKFPKGLGALASLTRNKSEVKPIDQEDGVSSKRGRKRGSKASAKSTRIKLDDLKKPPVDSDDIIPKEVTPSVPDDHAPVISTPSKNVAPKAKIKGIQVEKTGLSKEEMISALESTAEEMGLTFEIMLEDSLTEGPFTREAVSTTDLDRLYNKYVTVE